MAKTSSEPLSQPRGYLVRDGRKPAWLRALVALRLSSVGWRNQFDKLGSLVRAQYRPPHESPAEAGFRTRKETRSYRPLLSTDGR